MNTGSFIRIKMTLFLLHNSDTIMVYSSNSLHFIIGYLNSNYFEAKEIDLEKPINLLCPSG